MKAYWDRTPAKLRVADAFALHAVLTAVVVFGYVALVGTFPFNSFLAAFVGCIAMAVLFVGFRMQIDSTNAAYRAVSHERAYAELLFCQAVIVLVIFTFIG